MQVWQRGTSLTVNGAVNSDSFITDRFRAPCNLDDYTTTVGAATVSIGDAKSIGLGNSFKVTVDTAGVGGTSRDTGLTQYRPEAGDLRALSYGTSDAKEATLSFWVKSSVVGQYSFFMYNPTANLAFMPAYTIDTANTWERKTIVIPASGVGGGINADDRAEGFRIEWRASCSDTKLRPTASTAWEALSGYRAVAGDVDFFGVAGATWELTGVQLELGSVATPFEHRSYGEELALCQRYFFKDNSAMWANCSYPTTWSTEFVFNVTFPVPMRTTPSVVASYTNRDNVYSNSITVHSLTDSIKPNGCRMRGSVNTPGYYYAGFDHLSEYDAEL
jgi:hypothetical protein